MRWLTVFKGATAYEFQFWRFYMTVPQWRYLKRGCPVIFGFDLQPWD